MDMSYKQFMGMKTPMKSQADHLFNEVLGDISETLFTFVSLGCREEADSISALMTTSRGLVPEMDYFWDWMQTEGFDLLRDLDKRLPDVDELAEFLRYRKMILEMDAENGSVDMYLLTITEFLTVAKEFLAVYFETAAAPEKFHNQEKITIPSKEMTIASSDRRWGTITGSAPLPGAGLFLCA